MSEKSQTTAKMYKEFLTRTRMAYALMFQVKPGGAYAGMAFPEQEDIDVMYNLNESKRRTLYKILSERGVPKSRLNAVVKRYYHRSRTAAGEAV